MNEKLLAYKDKGIEYWRGRTKAQKGIFIGSFLLVVLVIILLLYFSNKTNLVPLYNNMTAQETGEVKANLDARGIPSEVSPDGTTISVPENIVNTLKVELAAEGIPRNGNIDYTSIQDQTGFGMTDNEFAVINQAAIQTELEYLIRSIDGVERANVMITLPEKQIWVSDESETATAAVSLRLAPGYHLDSNQVKALFHLISKSVPNLPIENIVIMDQMFREYDYNDENSSTTLTVYEQQRQIKRDIERDIQRQLQQMLGTMIGQDKVLVSVSTDIDFTQENRAEELVTPVDEENIEGLAVSIERITETYEGDEIPEGGIPGVGEGIPNYPGVIGGAGGEYERVEERVNNEVNRIHREIVESPYKIRDLGIQVMVEPPDGLDELPVERLDDIRQILSTLVRTSIDGSIANELTEEQINEKIFVSSQLFDGKVELEPATETIIPLWLYIVGGLLLAIIIVLVILLLRKRKQEEEEDLEEIRTPIEVPDIPEEDESEASVKRKQLERMAMEKPDEFAKLVRTWLTED